MSSSLVRAGGPQADPTLAGLPVTILAWTHIVLASIGLAAGLALFAVLWTPQKPYLAVALYVWAWPVTLVVLLLLAPLAGGIGLIRRRPWARDMIIAVSAVYLFVFPFGTALGGFGLWLLLRRRWAAANTASVVRQGGGLGRLMLVIAAAAVLFLVILGAGYSLDRLGYTIPSVPRGTRLVLGLSALVLGGSVLAIQALVRGRATRRFDTTMARDRSQRIVRLRANPATRRFAAMIESGQHWSDAQIAYALDQDMLTTCAHLQPIERAIRASGIECKPTRPEVVEASCRLDEAALGLVHPVSYREWLESERGEAGSPHAALYCEQCQTAIHVVHPDDATSVTPWFPRVAGPVGSP